MLGIIPENINREPRENGLWMIDDFLQTTHAESIFKFLNALPSQAWDWAIRPIDEHGTGREFRNISENWGAIEEATLNAERIHRSGGFSYRYLRLRHPGN